MEQGREKEEQRREGARKEGRNEIGSKNDASKKGKGRQQHDKNVIQIIFHILLFRKLYQKIIADNSIVKSPSEGMAAVRADEKHLMMDEHPYAETEVQSKPCDLLSST